MKHEEYSIVVCARGIFNADSRIHIFHILPNRKVECSRGLGYGVVVIFSSTSHHGNTLAAIASRQLQVCGIEVPLRGKHYWAYLRRKHVCRRPSNTCIAFLELLH